LIFIFRGVKSSILNPMRGTGYSTPEKSLSRTSLSRRPLTSFDVPDKSMAKGITRPTKPAVRTHRFARAPRQAAEKHICGSVDIRDVALFVRRDTAFGAPLGASARFSAACRAARSSAFLSLLTLLPVLLPAQTASIQIPSATPFSVELPNHVPMKAGEALEARLLYPIYVENQIAVPAGTVLRGTIVQLNADRNHRIHSRLRGDFTPFHIPVVRFDQLVLADGTPQAMLSENASDGAPVLRLSPPPGKKTGSFLSRQFELEKQSLKADAAAITAPGRGDRFVQFLYKQLPYHPERIDAGTSWIVELAKPLVLKAAPLRNRADPIAEPSKPKEVLEATTKDPSEWRLRAYLQRAISSATDKPGNTFQAVVAEPVFNMDHDLVVPQGSQLVGEITEAKPARSFGRQGRLRFHFKQLKLPAGFSQPVEATLAGIDSNKSANLQIDSEGSIQPQSRNRVLVPLVLTLLSARAYDEDGNRKVNSALGSNGLGIAGRLVGIFASSRNVGASIGVYGALVAGYDLWLARGKNVVFRKNTRIEITLTSKRSPLKVPGVGRMAAHNRSHRRRIRKMLISLLLSE
jgi:hypothetical protein